MTTMTFPAQQLRFGDLYANYDGHFLVTLSMDADASPGHTVTTMLQVVPDLVEAFDRHDGTFLSAPTYEERPDGSLRLHWSDYGIEEEYIGGEITVAADQVAPLRAWLSSLPRPDVPPALADITAEHEQRRRDIRAFLYGSLDDTLTHDGELYWLWARDNDFNGLYGLLHSDLSDSRRWLLRHADTGSLELCGRPQAPDRHGVPRRYLHPKPVSGGRWSWVRQPPEQRPTY